MSNCYILSMLLQLGTSFFLLFFFLSWFLIVMIILSSNTDIKSYEHSDQAFIFSDNLCHLRKPWFSITTYRKVSASVEPEEEGFTERWDRGYITSLCRRRVQRNVVSFTNRSLLIRMTAKKKITTTITMIITMNTLNLVRPRLLTILKYVTNRSGFFASLYRAIEAV